MARQAKNKPIPTRYNMSTALAEHGFNFAEEWVRVFSTSSAPIQAQMLQNASRFLFVAPTAEQDTGQTLKIEVVGATAAKTAPD